jgi:hypothetical protein
MSRLMEGSCELRYDKVRSGTEKWKGLRPTPSDKFLVALEVLLCAKITETLPTGLYEISRLIDTVSFSLLRETRILSLGLGLVRM